MRAIEIKIYGDPLEAAKLVDLPDPLAPAAGEALVEVEYAPVNPADLLLILGYYAVKPSLPSVVGNEGVGKVLEIGPGVANVKVGDRVALPLSSFTWRERMVIGAENLVVLPASVDPKQLSMTVVNPMTAYLLLNEFGVLKPGDWILQNAANSGVGRWVIAFARERGIKTINIVRRPELVDDLKAAGADAVLVDGPEIQAQIRAAIGDAPLKIAFDGVAGPASSVLTSALDFGGSIISYSAMSGQPITLNPVDTVFKDVVSRGVFIGHPQHAAKYPVVIEQAAQLLADGKIQVPVAAIYPLSAIKDAIAHAQNGGKVLLDIQAR